MSTSLAHRLGTLPAKKLAKATLESEAPSKFLGASRLGRVLERCFEHAHMTKDQASREMGYADASTVSKWIAGEVPFNFWRLWSCETLQGAFIAALAEDAGSRVEIETLVRVRRPA